MHNLCRVATEEDHRSTDEAVGNNDGEGSIGIYPQIIDPLLDLNIDIQTFDIKRKVAVYPDKDGIQWWIKAWFNNRRIGERAVQIPRHTAITFINEQSDKDEWLEEYYPQQMQVYHQAIAQTKEQLMKMHNS